MKGLIIRHLGREYRVGLPGAWITFTCTIIMDREEFVMESGGYQCPMAYSYQRVVEGLGIEIEVAEFDRSTGRLTPENPGQTGAEYIEMVEARKSDKEWDINHTLAQYRRLEALLRSEGLI